MTKEQDEKTIRQRVVDACNDLGLDAEKMLRSEDEMRIIKRQPVDLTRLIGDALSAWLDSMGIKIGGKNNEDSDCRWFLAQNIAMVVRPHIAQPMRESVEVSQAAFDEAAAVLGEHYRDADKRFREFMKPEDNALRALLEQYDIRRRGSDA